MAKTGRDRGESLPESIITLVIMGLFAVSSVLAFTTLISAAVDYRATASIDALLHNDVAEVTAQLEEGASPLYSPCATSSTYSTGPNAVTFGNEISGYTSAITSVAYWNGAGFGSTCATLPTIPTPQQITVTVTSTTSTQTGSALDVIDDPYTPENPPYDAALAQLAFVQQPTTINSLTPFSPAVQVAVEDANGNVLINDWSNMTLSVVPIAMTNGGVLVSCTGAESTGVFTFPSCTLDGGGEYELVASDQSATATSQPFNAIAQLDIPVVTSAASSPTDIGTVVATYTPSANAPSGQIYTGLACLDPVTERDCVTVTPFTTGESIGGLEPGEQYYVTVQADASQDYLDAKGLGVGPITAPLQAQAPEITAVTAPGADALNVTFTEASNASSPTFTAEACLDVAMSQNCVTVDNFVSGSNITALTANASYYVTVAMNSHANYLGTTSTPFGPTTVVAATTVTFNANGGTGTMSNEIENYGVAAPLTPNGFTPPLNGTFSGWNTAANGSGTQYADGATYPFASSVTLYAQWAVATVPGVPTNVVAVAGNASATVTWTAPSSNGGSPITSYTVTASDSTTPANGGETCTATTAVCTVNGLTNGDTYTFTVVATNTIGKSVPSAPSNAIVPITVAGAPTSVTAVAGNASATVTWTAPSSNGGSPITSYTVTASDSTTPANGGETCTATTAVCTVNGLTNGDTYTFTVVATTNTGNSTPSSPSNAVVPGLVPGAPTALSAIGPNNTLQFTGYWSAPAPNGGSTITDYVLRYSTDDATWTTVDTRSTALSYTLTVSSEVTYYVQVAALNATGQGPWSATDQVSWVVTGGTTTYGYTCPNGGTLDVNDNCDTSSYAATIVSTTYTCPQGGTLEYGADCVIVLGPDSPTGKYTNKLAYCQATYPTANTYGDAPSSTSCEDLYAAVINITYSCPSGGYLVAGTGYCEIYYAATYAETGSTTTYGFEGSPPGAQFVQALFVGGEKLNVSPPSLWWDANAPSWPIIRHAKAAPSRSGMARSSLSNSALSSRQQGARDPLVSWIDGARRPLGSVRGITPVLAAFETLRATPSTSTPTATMDRKKTRPLRRSSRDRRT